MTSRTIDNGFKPTLAEFKAHLRIVSNDLDTDLTAKLKAAILYAEHYIGLTIAKSTFVKTCAFSTTVRLRTPLIGVTSVKVGDTTLQTTDWSVADGVLTIIGGYDAQADIQVTYTAGMEAVPDDMTAAIMLHAAALFTNPVDSVETLPKASQNLLRSYRSWGLKQDID